MIVNSVLLQLDVPAAFSLFTQRIGDWWPADRRHTTDPNSAIILLESGRFFERASDGQEVELGKVTTWKEPHRILLDFYIATGPDHPTEVEIRFEPEGNAARVTVTHRPKAESAHLWDARSPKYVASWRFVLEALVKFSLVG
jgi:Activator of Hsp90 ATPase homolog 1-like protein